MRFEVLHRRNVELNDSDINKPLWTFSLLNMVRVYAERMHSHLFSWSVLPQILPTTESSDTMSSVSACLYHVIFIKSAQWVTGHASRFNSRRKFLSGIMSEFKKEDYIGVDKGDSAIRQQNHCQGLYFLVIKCVTWHGMKSSYIISQSGCQLARC